MAATTGHLVGKPGVAICIKGPGLANMVPGLAAASLEGWPMVALTEAYGPTVGAGLAHKRLNHSLLASALCKAQRHYGEEAEDFRYLSEVASQETPGPVLLELTGHKESRRVIPRVLPQQAGDSDVLSSIKAASHPVVIAGTLAGRIGCADELSRLRIPVFTTAAAKGLIDEAAEYAAGVYTGAGGEYTLEHQLLRTADLAIGIGLRAREVLRTKAFHCRAINVDPVVTADEAAFGFQSTSGVAGRDFWPTLQEKCWGASELREISNRLEDYLCQGFLPGRAYRVMQRMLKRDVRLVMDTGHFCTVGEHVWKARRADLCLMSGQGRYMGTSLPMAVGAALCEAAVPVVAVVGDGGIGMHISEARIAASRQLRILFVLMSDGGFGSIATTASREGLSRTSIQVRKPSWRRVMEAFGIPSWEGRDEDSLTDALQAWQRTSGPGFVELHFPGDAYERMCDRVR